MRHPAPNSRLMATSEAPVDRFIVSYLTLALPPGVILLKKTAVGTFGHECARWTKKLSEALRGSWHSVKSQGMTSGKGHKTRLLTISETRGGCPEHAS
jgi:hypothetical protein